MVRKLKPNELPGWPKWLDQKLAAAYCCLSIAKFLEIVDIDPEPYFAQRDMIRYDRDKLSHLQAGGEKAKDWLGKFRDEDENQGYQEGHS